MREGKAKEPALVVRRQPGGRDGDGDAGSEIILPMTPAAEFTEAVRTGLRPS